MFGKKNSFGGQRKIKEQLINDINRVLYELKNGKKINPSLAKNKERFNQSIKKLEKMKDQLANNLPTTNYDITNGCNKVRRDLEDLKVAANGEIFITFEECVDNLETHMQEIMDLEDGNIIDIDDEQEKTTKAKRDLDSRLKEFRDFENEFQVHVNKIEKQIRQNKAKVDELTDMIRTESDRRIQYRYYQSIKSLENQMDIQSKTTSNYDECKNMISQILTVANNLVDMSGISEKYAVKAKMILDIKNIRSLLDNPKELSKTLSIIKKQLDEVQNNINALKDMNSSTFKVEGENYDELGAFLDEMNKKDAIKADTKDVINELDDLLKSMGRK